MTDWGGPGTHAGSKDDKNYAEREQGVGSLQIEERHKQRGGGGGGSGCFVLQTLVPTPSGSIPISAIKQGDSVVSFDPYSGIIVPDKVIDLRDYSRRRIWRIVFDEQVPEIRTTWCHPFFTSKGMRWTFQLREKDYLQGLEAGGSETTYRVKSVEKTNEYADVRNLVTSRNGIYHVEGVRVGSFGWCRKMRLFIYHRHLSWVRLKGDLKAAF